MPVSTECAAALLSFRYPSIRLLKLLRPLPDENIPVVRTNELFDADLVEVWNDCNSPPLKEKKHLQLPT